MEYKELLFDKDGFWDTKQFEEELPIQFWQVDVPDQEHLDVLIKAWNDESVFYRVISGDPDEFDAIEKHVVYNGKNWLVWWSGNMAVQEISVIE